MKHDYKKIVGNIRKKSFPEIKGWIIVIQTKLSPFWGLFTWLLPWVRLIVINPEKTKGISKKEAEAIVAHELCHAVQGKRMGYFLFWIGNIRYWTYDESFRAKIENEADKMAIDRGYYEGIYAVTKKIEKAERKTGYYLTAKEIKDYYKSKK